MIQIYPYEMTAQLSVTGEDAADFLQSQFSTDLRPFEPGQATYGLWLDAKGKVVADSWVRCEGPECFHLFSEHCQPSVILEKLERHIIADDVELEILPTMCALAIIGEESAAVAEDCGASVILPGRRSFIPSRECVFGSAEARDAFIHDNEDLIVSESRIQELRLQAGVPLVPFEVGPGELPGEGGLDEDAVAYDKGCFLGQEVVARMRNVGKSTRGLYLVQGKGKLPECPQGLLKEGDKVIGELRTAYPDGDGWRGVALLKLRHASSSLQLESDVSPVQIEAQFQRVSK